MLSWILVGVLYLCGMAASYTIMYIMVQFEKASFSWVSVVHLLVWPLMIVVGISIGVYAIVKGDT